MRDFEYLKNPRHAEITIGVGSNMFNTIGNLDCLDLLDTTNMKCMQPKK